MDIKNAIPLYKAGNGKKVFLTLWARYFEHKGKQHEYFMVTRGEKIVPHEKKAPDAVVIVAKFFYNEEDHLVLTSEFRVPLGVRELGFPAGLIDESDYLGHATNQEAAARAAVREFKEETGLELEITEFSPPNLYSSAGMTNESVMYVFGKANGTPSKDYLENNEDIETLLVSRTEAAKLLCSDERFAHSKTAWPFLWAFAKNVL